MNQKYELLLQNNLPSDFYNLGKSKRKIFKKKIFYFLIIIKLLLKDEINNTKEINEKYSNIVVFLHHEFDLKLIDFGNSEKINI